MSNGSQSAVLTRIIALVSPKELCQPALKSPRRHKASGSWMWEKPVGSTSPSRWHSFKLRCHFYTVLMVDPLSPGASISHSVRHTIILSTHSLQNQHTLASKDCLLKVVPQLRSDWHAYLLEVSSVLSCHRTNHPTRLAPRAPTFSQPSPTTGLRQTLLLGKIFPHILTWMLPSSEMPSLSFQQK